MIQFILDAKAETRPLNKYWEFCVGSCHAATALRADWQEQMRRCRRDIGFRYVRFHGLLNDDMSVVKKGLLADRPEYCFTNIDKIFDFLLSIEMKPFVELGFMPSVLASGTKTVFAYRGNTTPPKNPSDWEELIKALIRHFIERYGRAEVRSWFFEIWNEPNLGGKDSPFGFWSADREDYFELYKQTANAVKQVDSKLRTGGPATSNNAWIPEFLDYCRKQNVPVDFISTHHYPTDVVLGYGVEDSGNFKNPLDMNDPEKLRSLMREVNENPNRLAELREEYGVFQNHLWEHVERGVLTDMAARARQEAGSLPLYYTEWGSLAGLPSDGPFGASFIAKTVMDNEGLIDGYGFWSFSDIFEESGQAAAAFHGGFGLLTQQGIPKAPYRVFQLLHRLGERRYLKQHSGGTVDIRAFLDEKSGAVQFLLVNHNSLKHPIEEEQIAIEGTGIEDGFCAEVIRVDENHANALAAWEAMGRPVYLTEKQRLQLEAVSEFTAEEIAVEKKDGRNILHVDLPAMGVALLTVYLK